MKIANTLLKKLKAENVFVDLFTDHFDCSLYGFIRNFNDAFLLLEHYDENGFYNGISIFRRQDVTRIKWNDNEINSTFEIIKRNEQISDLIHINIETIESIIKSIDKNFGYLSFQIQEINSNWTIIGELQEMDDETIIIKEFGTMSTLDRGMLILSIEEITRVDAGGIYETNLLKLHGKNN